MNINFRPLLDRIIILSKIGYDDNKEAYIVIIEYSFEQLIDLHHICIYTGHGNQSDP